MMRANRYTLAKLCLLTALAVPVQEAASAVSPQLRERFEDKSKLEAQLVTQRLVAQANSPEFVLPNSLEDSETLLVDGSSSMRLMNAALIEQFQARYPNATVENNASGSDVALNKLLTGEIALAAIGRPLTQVEIDAGLVAVNIAREKIAIFVGPDNPFNGDLTLGQFGQIFRGEITDWSALSEDVSGPIRFVDRPETSDTRQAFQPYPVFQTAPFTTGSTAEPVEQDETGAVIEALGDDGIGYATANQVIDNEAVKIVPMHKTLPDDPRYPFSQPRSYVYRGEPSPAIQGFLAIATSPDGQVAVEEIQAIEGAAAADIAGPPITATSPDGTLTAISNEDNVAVIQAANGEVVAGPLAIAGGAITALAFSEDGQTLATGTNHGKVRYWGLEGQPKGAIFQPKPDGSAITGLRFDGNEKLLVSGQGRSGFWGLNGLPYGETGIATAENATGAIAGGPGDNAEVGVPWWWWVVPLLGLLGVGAWLLGRERDQPAATEAKRQTAPTATVTPPVSDPQSDREISNRAQTVITTDRVTDDSRAVGPAAAAISGTLPVGAAETDTSVSAANLPTTESTDLESPNLEGTNLDLRTPGAVGGAAVLGDMMVAGVGANTEEEEENTDVWDDNLDLTLESGSDAANGAQALSENAEYIPTRSVAALSETTSARESPRDGAAPRETQREPRRDGIEPRAGRPTGTPPPLSSAETDDFWSTASTPETPVKPSSTADLSGLETIDPTPDMIVAETGVISDIEPTEQTIIGDSAVIGTAATSPSATDNTPPQPQSLSTAELATVDEGLPDLPEGYGTSHIVLLPRDPKWSYAYWDISNEHKEELRQRGGQQLMLRLYDVTDIDQNRQTPHSMQQQTCHEMARSWYLEMPVSDRDYSVEIGYLTADDRWLMLARSVPIRTPPIFPSDWVNDQFVTIDWHKSLVGQSFGDLGQQPEPKVIAEARAKLPQIYDRLFAFSQRQGLDHMAGSMFGSMQQLTPSGLTSTVGLNVSGLNVSGLNVSGLNVSGLNVSGLNLSGVGLARPRNFWLVADAELIVHGATEPNATLTVGDRVIPLNPDGTFRFHVAFPDGQIDYPIRAVAADGEQSRSIDMHFERETPERNTNTQAEAEDEWFFDS